MRKIFLIFIGIALILWLTGCAGTLHYGTYAQRQAEVFEAQANARAEIAKAWAELAKSGSPQTQGMAAMGLFALGMSQKPAQLQPPKDDMRDLINIVAPWFGAWAITDSIGRHMQHLGGQRTWTSNTYNVKASGTQSTVNTVPGNANTIHAYPATTTTTTTTTNTNPSGAK